MHTPYNETKFAELLMLVADRLRGDRAGGAVKLNKVLFFADFTHVRRHGRPITGAVYQKLAHGPAPRRLLPVRERLLREGDVELVRDEFLGRTLHRLIPRRPADLAVFTPDEIDTIERVLDDLSGLSGRQVSDLSHDEPGWQLVADGDTIPYEAALLGFPQTSSSSGSHLEQAVAQRYGLLAT